MGSLLASQWDVVVVGSGAAGLMTCLELPADLRVLLLSKQANPRSASRWAQGGIAAVTRPEDSPESHIADTLKAALEMLLSSQARRFVLSLSRPLIPTPIIRPRSFLHENL